MAIVVWSCVITFTFFMARDKSNVILRVLFAGTLVVTCYGGLRVFLFMMRFNFGDDIDFMIRGLSYLVPFVFTISSIVILVGLFRGTT